MKKRAFTLTELLVVVVIVGVLSAVVLPKFTKILQTRKTTEAENVMAAVRNEQEARCMVGRNYVGQNEIGKLASLPKAISKNYTYSLDAQGITATAKDGNYTLQIPSYTDGRICCSGEGCEKLNKDYPACNESFLAAIDQSACQAPIPEEPTPEPEPEPEPVPDCVVPASTTQTKTENCGCTSSGTKMATRTFDEVSCAWSDWTWESCSEKETECGGAAGCDESKKPKEVVDCKPEGYDSFCGQRTRSVTCDASTNEWQAPDWKDVSCEPTDSCPKPCPETCEGDQVRDRSVKTYTSDVGVCCRNSCDVVCTGSKEDYEKYGISNYGRPCRLINAQKKAEGDGSRVYSYWQGDRFYRDDPSSCYYCAKGGYTYPDLKDEQGNILVKGWDNETCSEGLLDCPEGYIKKDNVCYAKRHAVRKQATVGIRMSGFITTAGPDLVVFYEGGSKSVEGGGFITVKGYKQELGQNNLHGPSYGVPVCTGDPANLCNSCVGSECNSVRCMAQEDKGKVPDIVNAYRATETKNVSKCGGLSYQSNNGICALGEVTTASVYVCEL